MKVKVAFGTLVLLSFAVMLMLPLQATAGSKLAPIWKAIKSGEEATGPEISASVEAIEADGILPPFFPVTINKAYTALEADTGTEVDTFAPGDKLCMVYEVATWFGKVDYYYLVVWLPYFGDGNPGFPRIFPGRENPNVPFPPITALVYWKKPAGDVPAPGTYRFTVTIGGEGVPATWAGDYRFGGLVVQNVWGLDTDADGTIDFHWQDWAISNVFTVTE